MESSVEPLRYTTVTSDSSAVSEMQSGLDIGTTATRSKTQNYKLNRPKAMKKKAHATERSLDIQVTRNYGNTKINLNAGSYELFKETVLSFYERMRQIRSVDIQHEESQIRQGYKQESS